MKSINGQTFRYVDVGAANYTIEPEWFAGEGSMEVHLFEPDPDAAVDLRSQASKDGVQNFVHEVALGKMEEQLVLNICRKREVSSFLEPNRALLDRFPQSSRFDVEEKLIVETAPMDRILGDVTVDFMKLDVQGFELEVLKGARLKLRECIAVQLEVEFVEMYRNQPLFGDLSKFLGEHGFEFFDFTTTYHYDRKTYGLRSGQVLAADAVFVAAQKPVRFESDFEDLEWRVQKIAEGLGISEIADYYG